MSVGASYFDAVLCVVCPERTMQSESVSIYCVGLSYCLLLTVMPIAL